MFPAFLIRTGIDWIRHSDEFKDSNPYSRCQESVAMCLSLFEDEIGQDYLSLVETSAISAYWAEFFHSEDPIADEADWKDNLIKQSHKYDSFEDWQKWFKENYASVYKDDSIWVGVLAAAWAHTHQFEVEFIDDSVEFRPATPYLPTTEMWRLEPHIETLRHVIKELWTEEAAAYEKLGFTLEEQTIPYLGKIECLGFDTKKIVLHWPPQAKRKQDVIDLGALVADIILPPGDNWYRSLDNVIFADDTLDITSLVNRATYLFGSERRLRELTIDNSPEQARMQAGAEGWMVEIEASAPTQA